MDENNEVKKYEPFKIPSREQRPDNEAAQNTRQIKPDSVISFENQRFAEIEVSGTVNSNSSYAAIPKSQVIRSFMGEKREIFAMMRQIARENLSLRVDHPKIFYKQAVFMKDYEDDYREQAAFSAYYPYYQLMSYGQLRTYFTWRTNVRKGNVTNISTSYAFVYIYELLNNVGINDPEEGLCKLVDFWKAFRIYDRTIDKNLLKWIKDYHVYYEVADSFKTFAYKNNIYKHYPKVFAYESDVKDSLDMFRGISKYDIMQSAFYNEETSKLINDCFYFVVNRFRQIFRAVDMSFEDFVFQPLENDFFWMPFGGALFYPRQAQSDRQIALSEKEVYTCCQNKWSCSSVIIMESGRQFIGYIMKQMESALRKTVRFKYRLSPNISMVDWGTRRKLEEAGISLEKVINDAVSEFHSGLNRKVISVDTAVLEKIRVEALDTQEKLIVQEDMDIYEDKPVLADDNISVNDNEEAAQVSDEWTSFKQSLTKLELDALLIILQSGDIKNFSDMNGIMMEVLIDNINQKAYDIVSDNILDLDDNVAVYQEYREKLIEMVDC